MKPEGVGGIGAGVDLDAGSVAALRAYERLLKERAVPIGLIAQSDASRIWQRHVADSLRAVQCLTPSDRLLIDLGSGAGLPGIPLAIARPDLTVLLVEPKARRVGFLELVRDAIDVPNVRIVPGTHASVPSRADVCTARALASPAVSWDRAQPLLVPGGRLIYFAGRSWGPPDEERMEREAIRIEICAPSHFPWQGPLVIMTEPTPSLSGV